MDPDLRVHVRRVSPLISHNPDSQKPCLREDGAIVIFSAALIEKSQ